ncbi:MAG: hypothetical protein GC191_09495 [Azospirillum sp.]|nr:hypothetical protein [Azospirillum sp.]
MLAPIEEACRAALDAAAGGWPLRWPGEAWGPDVKVSPGGLPIDDAGAPVPFIEVELSGGKARRVSFPSADGKCRFERAGTLRLILSIGSTAGTAGLDARASALSTALGGKVPIREPDRLFSTGVVEAAAAPAAGDGTRLSAVLSLPFTFSYRA